MWEGMTIVKNRTFDNFAIIRVLELTHCLEPELGKLDLVVGVRIDEGFQEGLAPDWIGGDIVVKVAECRWEDVDRALSTWHDVHVKVGALDTWPSATRWDEDRQYSPAYMTPSAFGKYALGTKSTPAFFKA